MVTGLNIGTKDNHSDASAPTLSQKQKVDTLQAIWLHLLLNHKCFRSMQNTLWESAEAF
jgi:hypothetical protein